MHLLSHAIIKHRLLTCSSSGRQSRSLSTTASELVIRGGFVNFLENRFSLRDSEFEALISDTKRVIKSWKLV